MEVLLIANDNLIQVVGLENVSTGEFVNDGVGTATLKDASGGSVAGATGLTLAYVASSNGNYEAQLPASVSLTDGVQYKLHVDFSSPAIFHAEIPCVARIRRS